MQVAFAGVDEVGEVDFDEDIEGETLAGFLHQRDVELPHDLAAAAVCAEEVFGSDVVGCLADFVTDEGEDAAGGFAGEGDEGGAEADVPAFCGSTLDDDGLEDGLREVDVPAWCCTLILSSAVGIVAP